MLIMTPYKTLLNLDNICGFTITEINGVFRVIAIDIAEPKEPWIVADVITNEAAEKVLLDVATAYASGQKFLGLCG